MNLLLPSFTWFLIVLVAFVFFHVKKWNRERNSITVIKHKKTAWYRVAALSPSTIGLTVANGSAWYISFSLSILVQFFLFWFLFDGFYNICRIVDGKRIRWYVVGTIDDNEAATDNFIRRHGQSVKIIGCIVFIVLYLTTYFNYKFVL